VQRRERILGLHALARLSLEHDPNSRIDSLICARSPGADRHGKLA
jgi:hypothetical protein